MLATNLEIRNLECSHVQMSAVPVLGSIKAVHLLNLSFNDIHLLSEITKSTVPI